MFMHVMHIGHMRMCMSYPRVLVSMRVRLAWRIIGLVRMLMVLVVHMRVRVHGRLMNMVVFVMLCEVEPNTECHKTPSDEQLNAGGFAKRDDGNRRAEKRGGREIGSCARRTKVTERADEQNETNAITNKADERGENSS